MQSLQPVSKTLLFTKNDKEDPRLGECVQLFDGSFSENFDVAILGYPDDEGIALNGGRTGAHLAPDLIRQYLYKMTPHLVRPALPKILDLGNVSLSQPLLERHEQGRTLCAETLKKQKRFISFGGGHDYGYADTAGFLDQYPNGIVINFDAHLDVRPTDKGINSGTPFYRMLNQYPQVQFVEVGIQNQCNSAAHLAWVKSKNASVLTLEDIRKVSLLNSLQSVLANSLNRPLFVSFDIDAFTSSEAPGCSQSWTSGLHFTEVSTALDWLYQNFATQGLGIYEVSPPLDQDNRTSKLAALLAHQFLFSQGQP